MATPEEQQKFLENLQGGTNDVTGMTPEETDEAAGLVVSQGADVTPAIDKSKIVTTTEPAPFGLGLLGIGVETDRDLYAAVNPFVTTPNVSVTEVMNFQFTHDLTPRLCSSMQRVNLSTSILKAL